MIAGNGKIAFVFSLILICMLVDSPIFANWTSPFVN